MSNKAVILISVRITLKIEIADKGTDSTARYVKSRECQRDMYTYQLLFWVTRHSRTADCNTIGPSSTTSAIMSPSGEHLHTNALSHRIHPACIYWIKLGGQTASTTHALPPLSTATAASHGGKVPPHRAAPAAAAFAAALLHMAAAGLPAFHRGRRLTLPPDGPLPTW